MNQCFEPEEPGAPERLLSCSGWEDPEFSFDGCPAIGVGGRHSESYGEDGEWHCDWCGKQPCGPVVPCSFASLYDFTVKPSRYPHLCEVMR